MTKVFIFGTMLTLTGVAFGGGSLGLGLDKPSRKAMSVRTESFSGGASSSRSRRRHRSGGFFVGGSGSSGGGGFSFGK